MANGNWTSGNKEWIVTAFEEYDSNLQYTEQSPTAPLSKVWGTGGSGVVQEVYWPTIDQAQVRQSELMIHLGQEWISDSELSHSTKWLSTGVPHIQVESQDKSGRFLITKKIFTDPDRNVLVQDIQVQSKLPVEVYWHHQSAAGNTPFGDSGRVRLVNQNHPASMRASGDPSTDALLAWQGKQVQALIFSIPMLEATVGFNGSETDGRIQLKRSGKLEHSYRLARDGRIVLSAKLDCMDLSAASARDRSCRFTSWLGFGDSEEQALLSVTRSKAAGLSALEEKYIGQWASYQDQVRDLSKESLDQGRLFRASVAILKSIEDKTFAGAFIASPSIPWGQHNQDSSSATSTTGGYHLVWPRDLYQMATAFLALGDLRTSQSCLNTLKRLQFGPNDGDWDQYGPRRRKRDGSFPQNTWVDGRPYWKGLQMDQTAMPVLLVYRLWKANAIQLTDYWDLSKRALDFIADFGPWTAQERWEENFGASPSTIAAEIAALWVGADIAEAMGDHERARKFRVIGDAWAKKPGDNIDTWTYTKSGGFGIGEYYLRIEAANRYDQVWNPNDDAEFYLSNQGGARREKSVTDAGFLELVRFGVKPATAPEIVRSIIAVDQTLRVDLGEKGVSFRRYYGDRYSYDDRTGRQTPGMPWILLVGERGHFELAHALESGLPADQARLRARPYLASIENLATQSLQLPEQVWDQDLPSERGKTVKAGEPNGSATPLGWSHGEYIKLLRSLGDAGVFDRLQPVADRASLLSKLSWAEIESLLH